MQYLIGGILIGIFLINIAARRGHTHFNLTATNPIQHSDIHHHPTKQESAGKETTDSTTIDSLSFHLSLILSVSGLAFCTTYMIHKIGVPLLGYIPEWGYAIVIMYIVWGIMQKANLTQMVDRKTITKIRATFTEYLIVAAIVSLPIQAVFSYFLPILIMVSIGMIFTILLSIIMAKKLLRTYWFEKSMVIFGTSTGVFLTGLILLKMIDPKMETPVLKDYSISFTMYSILSFILFPLTFGILIHYGLFAGILFFLVVLFIYLLFILIVKRKEDQTSYL